MAASNQDLNNLVAQDTKASMTAVSVAMAFMRTLDSEYSYLSTSEELALIKHFVTLGKQGLEGWNWGLFKAISACPNRLQRYILDSVVVPGFDLHMTLRKLMIKNKIQSAISKGVEQVVFLGGGYDIRAFVSALQYPAVKFFECDRGQTRRIKLNGLRTIPSDIELGAYEIHDLDEGTVLVNDNLFYIDCDLMQDDLHLKLSQHGFSCSHKTLIIAEGLTMYFHELELKYLLGKLQLMLQEGDELILSFMTETYVSAINTAAVNESDEPLLFALPRESVVSFVGEIGFSVESQFDSMNRFAELGVARGASQMEYYYLLQRTDNIPNRSLNDIPEIDFEIPEADLNDSAACRLM